MKRSATKPCLMCEGTLPVMKKLSGIRSQEVAEGFNHWRFDDTTGQISVQLHSSHGSQLSSISVTSVIQRNENSDGRGEGFELRTDQMGSYVCRQGSISTYAQDQAVADHLAASEAQSMIQGHDSMHMLSTLAVKQQTDALNVINRLPKLIQLVELKGAKLSTPSTCWFIQNCS